MNKPKNIFIDIAKWTLFVLLIFLSFKIVDVNQIEKSILSISIFNLSIFFVFAALSRFFYALRWKQIISKGLKSSYTPIFFLIRINLLGEFVGITTPSSLGGEALRVFKLNTLNISKKRGAVSILLDRMIGLGSIVIMTALLLPIIGVNILHSIDQYSYLTFFIILCALIVCVILILIIKKKSVLESYNKICMKISFSLSSLVLTIVLSVIGHIIFAVGFYILFLEIFPIPFLTATAFIFTSQITRTIPISIFGIGIGEGTMIGLASLLGIEAEAIFVIILISLGSRYLFATLGLLLELIHDGNTILKNRTPQKD